MAPAIRLLGATVLASWLATPLAQNCQGVEARAEGLRAKLEAEVSAQARSAAQAYVAKPTPGSDAPKAWNDFSAHALLYGDARTAAWAALQALRLRMSGDTLTTAGVAFSYHGDNTTALALLHCAYALGHRRANLLEALAVIHRQLGRGDEARRYIAAAREADSRDPLVEIAHAIITTGKPPPRQPRPKDAMERCIAELEDHSLRVLGRVSERADRFQALTGHDLRKYVQPLVAFHEQNRTHLRGLVTQARSMPPVARTTFASNVIMQCVAMYFHYTGNLLEAYFDTTFRDYTALTFWADALGIDAAPYWREQGSRPVIVGALNIPSRPYITELWAEARECAQQRLAYERQAAHSRQRFRRAGMRFDEIAFPLMNIAEQEILAAREFAARMAAELKDAGPSAPYVQQINATYRRELLDNWLDGKVPMFFNELGTTFQHERQGSEQDLQNRKQMLDMQCPAVPPEVMEALLAEAWKEYRDGLWQALLGNFEAQWDARLNCDFSIDGFSGQLFDDGEYEVGYKGKAYSCKVGPGGAGSIGAGPFSTTMKDGEFTAVDIQGSDWSATVDRSGLREVKATVGKVSANYPPFTGAGKLTIGGQRDSRTGRMEPKVGFSGKLGLGLKNKVGGAACYPGSGSVSVMPRKALEDAVRYALSGR
jgi:hypothetical protein